MESLIKRFASLWPFQSRRGASGATRARSVKGLEKFSEQIQAANNIIIMCGAGLSVSAGIPDFRTPGTGLYSQLEKYELPYPEAVFEISYALENPEPFRKLACELWPGRRYDPTLGHYFIKLLNDKGKLLRCFTQNIDSLESLTGLPKEKIVAAHGNFDSASCVVTKQSVPVDEVRDAYLNNTHEELNQKYSTTFVKPDIVFFGEDLPARYFECAKTDFPKCDLLIVIGTSLKVHPFASLIENVSTGTPRLLINRDRVGEYFRGFDFTSSNTTDMFFQGDCDVGCSKLAKLLKWDTELEALMKHGTSVRKGTTANL